MKVILLKDVAKIGRKFDIKEVSDGHALNFLVPKKLAIVATPKEIAKIESIKATNLSEKNIQNELLSKNLETLDSSVVVLKGKANEKGHLFAGFDKKEVIKEISKQIRVDIPEDFIALDKPIKEVGEHKININHGPKKVSFIIKVEAE